MTFFNVSDSENLSGILVAHTDAVWDLAVQTGSLQLLSASADGTCRLWSPTLKSPLLNSYIPEQGKYRICLQIHSKQGRRMHNFLYFFHMFIDV